MTLRASTLVALAALLLPPAAVRGQEHPTLPDGEGKALVEAVCSQCHELRPLFMYKTDDRGWDVVVHEMVAFGAQVTPRERDTILAYLKATFSTSRASAKDAEVLPAGKGREVLQASCGSCHGTALIAKKRADRPEWDAIVQRHLKEKRVALSPEQHQALLAYLAAHFKRNGRK